MDQEFTSRNLQRRELVHSVRKAIEQNKDLIEFWNRIRLVVNDNCRVCYGRGYVGWDTVHQKEILCHKCFQVEISWPEVRVSEEVTSHADTP